MLRCLILSLALAIPVRGYADAPSVVADIAPVHSLVAQVMQGVGEPFLLVPPGVSPHGFALRPSQAQALQDADLMVWIGPDLTPWLEKPLDSLAANIRRVGLLDAEATRRLPYRELDDEDHDHGHDHSGTDPHAWLDPDNAVAWLDVIAAALAELDPANAATYAANAAAAKDRVSSAAQDLERKLAPVRGVPFVASHDAYQYFETRFGLTLAGTVAGGDAADPGPAHLDDLRQKIAGLGIRCAFTEPQLKSGLLRAVAGQGVRIDVLDPLGASQTPGPDLLVNVLTAMGDAFAGCLGE